MFARLESQVDYNRNLSGAEPGELHLETPFVGKVKSEPLSKVRRKATTASSSSGIIPEDVYGNAFPIAVDTEHKATQLHIFSLRRPHMRTFYIHIFAFFTAFMSSFTTSSLMPIIREDLGITRPEIGYGGLMAFTGNVIMRFLAGVACDYFGPRYTMAGVILLTMPAVFGMALVQTVQGFYACRFIVGMQLASFVVNQYVATTFFSTKVVGFAAAIAAGWGNAGAGFIQILMPRIVLNMSTRHDSFLAWRLAFLIPGCFNLLAGYLVLRHTVDAPDGNYRTLIKAKWRVRESMLHLMYFGAANYRTWILATAYGFSFGAAICVIDSGVGPYLETFFGKSPLDAVSIGGSIGLMALGFRPLGGWMSDRLGFYFGMRGRIWNLWIPQTLAGIMCMVLSRQTTSYGSTITCYIFLGIFFFYAMGATMGISAFVSPRCTGMVIGLIGAGGTAGAAIINDLYFRLGTMPLDTAFNKTGTLIIWVSFIILALYWPMYGGAFLGRFGTTTEEFYFLSDFTVPEIRRGFADRMVLFAAEARSERGRKKAEAYEQNIRDARKREKADAARDSQDGGAAYTDSEEDDDEPTRFSELRPPARSDDSNDSEPKGIDVERMQSYISQSIARSVKGSEYMAHPSNRSNRKSSVSNPGSAAAGAARRGVGFNAPPSSDGAEGTMDEDPSNQPRRNLDD